MSMTRPRRAITPIVLAFAAVCALSGCIANPIESLVENGVKNGVEQAVEGATGQDVDLGSPGTLPDGFPADDVPLIDGEITYSLGTSGEDGGGWAVFIAVADKDQAFDALKKKLTDAGFEATMESNEADTAVGIFTSEEYVVQASVTSDGEDGVVAQYVVSSAGAAE